MASVESEILKRLHGILDDHCRWSMASPFVGGDNSVANAAGFRQGVYRGLQMSIDAISEILEDKAKKDDLL